jgi:hypothetical protein
VYFWKSGRRVVFLTIWKRENIVWQLLIRIVKIWIIMILIIIMIIIIIIVK